MTLDVITQDDLEAAVAKALEGLRPWYGPQELAAMYGISVPSLRAHPWLLPRFGEPDLAVGNRKRWSPESVAAWCRVPMAHHEREFYRLSKAERKRRTA